MMKDFGNSFEEDSHQDLLVLDTKEIAAHLEPSFVHTKWVRCRLTTLSENA